MTHSQEEWNTPESVWIIFQLFLQYQNNDKNKKVEHFLIKSNTTPFKIDR